MEKNLKNLLTSHGFSFKKNFGQNFLTDNILLDEIVQESGVAENDQVLEIGVGAGALTKALAKKCKSVLGYEIDLKLKPILSEVLEDYSNVELVFKDVLKDGVSEIDKKLSKGYYLVANLPYYITTPIILEFLEKSTKVKKMVIMVQEEVAERLASKEGSSLYGAITVAINLRGSAKIIKRVPREKFTPSPNVDSAVVCIEIAKDKFKGVNLKEVRDVVRAGFSSRRKMLVNNLINSFKLSREDAESIIAKSGVSPTARAEQLSAEQFVLISQNYKEYKNG